MGEGRICEKCGKNPAMAIIKGKFYCFKCAGEMVREHVLKQIEQLRERGWIEVEGRNNANKN